MKRPKRSIQWSA